MDKPIRYRPASDIGRSRSSMTGIAILDYPRSGADRRTNKIKILKCVSTSPTGKERHGSSTDIYIIYMEYLHLPESPRKFDILTILVFTYGRSTSP